MVQSALERIRSWGSIRTRCTWWGCHRAPSLMPTATNGRSGVFFSFNHLKPSSVSHKCVHNHTQGRLYRLFDLFALIEHKVLLSQFMLMLVRNSTYVFYIVHWMACILFYVARVDGFSENTWLGREEAQARIEGQGLWAK
eukprot:scaffold155510_cov18-Tisochrysis_lutea.AAC.1